MVARKSQSPADATVGASRRCGQRGQARKQQEQDQHAKARRRIKERAADRQAERQAAQAQQQVEAQAKMAQMPIVHEHAAGIDVGDASHWVCVECTADGSDTVREFPAHTPAQLGLCPNWHKTGGKVKSSHTRQGKNRAASALRLAAWSLMRSHSYLGAYLRRQRARLGAPKAITATAHKLARIVYNLMRYGVAYMQRTEAEYAEQVRERLEKSLHRRARELGFELKRIEPATTTCDEAPALAQVIVDGEVVTVTSDGEIVSVK